MKKVKSCKCVLTNITSAPHKISNPFTSPQASPANRVNAIADPIEYSELSNVANTVAHSIDAVPEVEETPAHKEDILALRKMIAGRYYRVCRVAMRVARAATRCFVAWHA